MATWHVFRELNVRIRGVLQRSRGAWGFVDDAWLKDAIDRFGPLTHHVQLKASILMDALRANGIAIDARRWEEKLGRVRRDPRGVPGADAAARLPGGRVGVRQGNAIGPGAVPARTPRVGAEAVPVGQGSSPPRKRIWPSWRARTSSSAITSATGRPRSWKQPT